MVQLSTCLGIASLLVSSIHAHAVPQSVTPVKRQAWPELEKTPFTKDFAPLEAQPDRIPKSTPGTFKRWPAGKYPKTCLMKAKEGIPGTKSPVCPVGNLEVYNVTYQDCTGRKPRVFCRCNNAETSIQEMIHGMGTVPLAARSNVLEVIWMNGRGGSGGGGDWNSLWGTGRVGIAWFTHEAIHCNDRPTVDSPSYFSLGPTWAKAVAADSCVVSNYANANVYEDFVEVGTWLNYDINGHKIDYIARPFLPCLKHQLDAARAYIGDRLNKNTKCFNSPAAGARGSTMVDAEIEIIEIDPNAEYGELLPYVQPDGRT